MFIHSSVDGHLGCFHLLRLMNNVAMNSGPPLFLKNLKVQERSKKHLYFCHLELITLNFVILALLFFKG